MKCRRNLPNLFYICSVICACMLADAHVGGCERDIWYVIIIDFLLFKMCMVIM